MENGPLKIKILWTRIRILQRLEGEKTDQTLDKFDHKTGDQHEDYDY